MSTTTAMREAWSPPCAVSSMVRVQLYGGGAVTVDRRILPALQALNDCLAAARYATRQGDTGAYNCRPITGGTGYSLHAFGIAIDVNWTTNPYGPVLRTDMPPSMIAAIESIRTVDGLQVWRWGGRYSGNKDAMHFEVVVTPAQLARGLARTSSNDGSLTMSDVEKILAAIDAAAERNAAAGVQAAINTFVATYGDPSKRDGAAIDRALSAHLAPIRARLDRIEAALDRRDA